MEGIGNLYSEFRSSGVAYPEGTCRLSEQAVTEFTRREILPEADLTLDANVIRWPIACWWNRKTVTGM